MSFPKPKIPTPAAAPPAADITPAEQKLGSNDARSNEQMRRKKGRASLRIDLQHGGSGMSPGATGVNIPTK